MLRFFQLGRATTRQHVVPYAVGLRIAQPAHSSASAPSSDEIDEARQWLSTFTDLTIPRRLFDITYSRSSGPGGQNVNKVNSKATIKIPGPDLRSLIPSMIQPHLSTSRFYAAKTDSFVVQADSSRKQEQNAEECMRKLKDEVSRIAHQLIPGETRPETRASVQKMIEQNDRKRLNSKKAHSEKKGARKSKGSLKPDY